MESNPFPEIFEKLRHRRYGQLSFHAICPKCGEPVQADNSIDCIEGGYVKQPNATCLKCGRVEMPFDGVVVKK